MAWIINMQVHNCLIDSANFSRLVEGIKRHHLTILPVAVGDQIIFQDSGRKAVFLVTYVDELLNPYGNYYCVSLRLQEWASTDI
jgi:hypothetical protein